MLKVGPIADESVKTHWTEIYEAIKEAILQHNLVPGAKLPEDELCDIYSISRTVVRSALQALAHDQLVELKRNRGAFVAKPSKREALEVFDARAIIEPRVAAMAAERARPADVKRLRAHLQNETKAIEAGHAGEAILLSARFHEAIADIAGQSVLTEIIRRLCSRSSLVILIYARRSDACCETHAHRALVDAIAGNKAGEASDLMTSHLVDLLSAIDPNDRKPSQRKLAEILKPAKAS